MSAIYHWQSIETSPKQHGSEALVWSPTQGMYLAVRKDWWTPKFPQFAGDPIIGPDINQDITHWMPLPEPPNSNVVTVG